MADSQSIIALNIGSQRISMGVFAQTKKGLVLKSQGATSILADPATEAARIPQVQLAIKELAKSLKLAKQKTAYSLSGQSVFVRFVKLPPLEEENVDVPFSIKAKHLFKLSGMTVMPRSHRRNNFSGSFRKSRGLEGSLIIFA